MNRVRQFAVGSLVDIRDLNYIWNAGTVNAIVTLHNMEKYALIEYIGLDEKYNEYVSVNSDRLAVFGFYTNRDEIPKYVKIDESMFIVGLNENNNEALLVEDNEEHISDIALKYPFDSDMVNYENELES